MIQAVEPGLPEHPLDVLDPQTPARSTGAFYGGLIGSPPLSLATVHGLPIDYRAADIMMNEM